MKNTYSEMKDSGVEWIGQIPKAWDIVRIKRIFSISRGEVLAKTEIEQEAKDGFFPVYSSQTKNDGCMGYIPSYMIDRDGLTWTTDGANAGTVFLRKGKYNITNVCGLLLPKSKNSSLSFLNYSVGLAAFHNRREDINGYKIMSNEMADIQIIHPSLPEQTAIAAYLDEKCGAIDEIIEQAKASIEEYKAWKSSVIFEAVTKGLDPHAEMKDSGVEWIGKVPRHWKKTPVKSIARFINGYAFSSDLLIQNALFPVIRIGDILDNGSVNFKHALGIDELINNLEGFTIQKNDVLIAMSGATTGKVCVITEAPPKAFINQRVGIVRSCKHSKYLYYCLSTDIFKEYVLLLSAGSAQPNLSTAGIKNYQIICPPDNEIESITRYLDEKCAVIDGIIAEKEALIADMEAYKKSLIFETVTGKRKVC